MNNRPGVIVAAASSSSIGDLSINDDLGEVTVKTLVEKSVFPRPIQEPIGMLFVTATDATSENAVSSTSGRREFSHVFASCECCKNLFHSLLGWVLNACLAYSVVEGDTYKAETFGVVKRTPYAGTFQTSTHRFDFIPTAVSRGRVDHIVADENLGIRSMNIHFPLNNCSFPISPLYLFLQEVHLLWSLTAFQVRDPVNRMEIG